MFGGTTLVALRGRKVAHDFAISQAFEALAIMALLTRITSAAAHSCPHATKVCSFSGFAARAAHAFILQRPDGLPLSVTRAFLEDRACFNGGSQALPEPLPTTPSIITVATRKLEDEIS